MLRSCLKFFKCKKNHETENTQLFPKKLLSEVEEEIKYRQRCFIACTLLTGTMVIAGTCTGIGFLFKLVNDRVTDLSRTDTNDKIHNVDYHVNQILLYLALPSMSLATVSLEFTCLYQHLKKYFHYAENTPLTDLSPALYEKVKDYLRIIQYSTENLSLSDLQEILTYEADRNSVHEPINFYYPIP